MKSIRTLPVLAMLIMADSSTSQLQGDPVWPPEAPDPGSMAENPEPGSKLFMDEISFTIVDEFGNPDLNISQWFTHMHHGSYEGNFAFGDLSGPDDGDFDIAMSMGHQAVMAGRVAVDWPSKTGTITPIFMYLSNRQVDDAIAAGQSVYAPNALPHGGSGRNILICDFDGDGKNEVAAQLAENDGGSVKRYLVLLQEDPSAGASSYGYTTPEPVTLARSPTGLADGVWPFYLQERMGTCRLSNQGHMIVLHNHDVHDDFVVWSYAGGVLELKYMTSIGNGTQFSDGVKTHEFNYVDVDGDGYDEFFVNGLIDFVDQDANGEPFALNSLNPENGIAKWVTGMASPGPHMDQMIAADWDPDRPGIELIALPEFQSGQSFDAVSPCSGGLPTTFDQSREMLYDALTGEILRVNDGVCEGDVGASLDQQVVIGGNFTAQTEPGVTPGALEAMFIPKNLGGNATSLSPPAEPERSGNYVIDYMMNELVADGINFMHKVNPYYSGEPAVGLFVTGPGRNEIRGMDWDGDRFEDEIFCRVEQSEVPTSIDEKSLLTVFRLGRKEDWSAYPDWLPEEHELVDGNDIVQPFQFDSNPLFDHFIHYYQGTPPSWWNLGAAQPDWAWNNNGPGRYTHYYEKLGHVWPRDDEFKALPYDVGDDHREELIVMNEHGLFAYRNDDALAVPELASPHLLPEYRRWRQEPLSYPFEWQSLPALVDLEIRPTDPALPTRVVGMPKRLETLQLKAIAHYSDGREVDVTNAVTWIPDADTDAFLTLSSTGLLSPQNEIVSARVQARLGATTSNTLYVQATSEIEPVILMAGYDNTYLDQGNAATQRLRVVAYVAQKDNDPDLLVTMVTPGATIPGSPGIPETYWRPHGQTIWLVDDGQTGTNGDEVAGDGIYSAFVDPGPQAGDGLQLGENLKFVQAALWDPITTIVGSTGFTGSPNFDKGETWPSVVVGPGSPVITEPAPAAPTVVDDNLAFWGPRVGACGTRGYGVDDDYVLLEAVILPAALVTDPLVVEAYLPWNGTTVTMTASPDADGVFTALIDHSGVANGAYLIDVQAKVLFSGIPPYTEWPSDWCGRLYLHDAIPD